MNDPVIIIGGGPRPQATVFALSSVQTSEPNAGAASGSPYRYLIMDGMDILAICPKYSHAMALLPLIQSGG